MSWNARPPANNNSEIPGAAELIDRYKRLAPQVQRLAEISADLLKIAEELEKEENQKGMTNNK